MIDKQISENKIDAEQEVQLYLSILKRQGKYGEALEFLEGDLGKNIYPGAPVELKIELLKSLDRWGECNVLLKDLLREKYDQKYFFIECLNAHRVHFCFVTVLIVGTITKITLCL